MRHTEAITWRWFLIILQANPKLCPGTSSKRGDRRNNMNIRGYKIDGDKLERWTTNYVNIDHTIEHVMKHILLRLIYKVKRKERFEHPASYDVNEYVAKFDSTFVREDFIKNLRNENRKQTLTVTLLTKRGSFDTKCFVNLTVDFTWKRFIEGLVILEMTTMTDRVNRLNTSLTGGSVRLIRQHVNDPEYLKQFRDSKLRKAYWNLVKLMGISDGIWKDSTREQIWHGTPPASDSSYPFLIYSLVTR
ncbi:hypothetical protein SPFM12_00058 [Salmonella phage SPFM12]|nr:hypothetical protein SPFM12_00058 [Salmonella phage SPFM12]